MELFVRDKNGEMHRVEAVHKCIDGEFVKLEEGTPEYYEALAEAARQGVLLSGA